MTTRKAVPLSSEELAAIDRARTSGILAEVAGQDAVRSEAATLHALIVLGLEHVAEHLQLSGYAALAASSNSEDWAHEAALRARRRGGNE